MLTAKQHQTYQFIKKYFTSFGYAPTVAEIATGIGIKSRGVVYRYITALSAAGLIEIIPNRKRNIRILEDPDAANDGSLPVLGKIAAGSPIEVVETQKFFNVTNELMGPNRFILEVSGDSMIGDCICDKDLIICERRNHINKNDIAIALIDNQEVTLKRIEINNDKSVTLIASNIKYAPRIYAAERVEIQGIFIGLLRLDAL